MSPLRAPTCYFESTTGQLALLALLVQQEELEWDAATTMSRMLLERSDALRTAAAALVGTIAAKMGTDHVREVAAVGAPHTKGRQEPSPTEVTAQLAAAVRVVAFMALERGVSEQELQGKPRELYTRTDVEPLPMPMVQAVVDALYDRCACGVGVRAREWASRALALLLLSLCGMWNIIN